MSRFNLLSRAGRRPCVGVLVLAAMLCAGCSSDKADPVVTRGDRSGNVDASSASKAASKTASKGKDVNMCSVFTAADATAFAGKTEVRKAGSTLTWVCEYWDDHPHRISQGADIGLEFRPVTNASSALSIARSGGAKDLSGLGRDAVEIGTRGEVLVRVDDHHCLRASVTGLYEDGAQDAAREKSIELAKLILQRLGV
jgi:hypothetical protein